MPNRYIVHGVDGQTGQRVKKVVEASSSADAEAIATRIGVKVDGSEIDPSSLGNEPAPSRRGGGAPVDSPTEQIVWKGNPSLWNNFWWYLSCLLIVTIPWAIYAHIRIKSTKYSLSNQRLRIESGIFTKQIEDVELYRVLDSGVEQGVLDGLLSIGTVVINSSDERMPIVKLVRIADPRGVREHLRELSEARRRWRKVQEIDVQNA